MTDGENAARKSWREVTLPDPPTAMYIEQGGRTDIEMCQFSVVCYNNPEYVNTSCVVVGEIYFPVLYYQAVGDDCFRFDVVGYGCMTCIGNSGPLADPVADAIEKVRSKEKCPPCYVNNHPKPALRKTSFISTS